MINGLEGIPGSGKSYEASVYHVLPALEKGRKVITNLPLDVGMYAAINPDYADLIELRTNSAPIRGTWDATRANAFELFEDGHTVPQDVSVPLFGSVWDFYSDWKHPDTGHGPLFIVDECHVCFPKIGTEKAVIEWFKLHRHFNVDVLLATQNFRDVNESIRGLLAMLVKVRKADVLGKSGSYIRKVHGGYRGGLVSREERKYKPEMFRLYRSHTQGSSVAEAAASDVKPFIVKFRRFTIAFWIVAILACIYAAWPSDKKKTSQVKRTVSTVTTTTPTKQGPALTKQGAQPAETTAVPEAPPQDPEPLGAMGVHVSGYIVMPRKGSLYMFWVSMQGKRLYGITDKELTAMGYKWEPSTKCSGYLRWQGNVRAVTCDPPAAGQGDEYKPVVVAIDKQSGDQLASSRDR